MNGTPISRVRDELRFKGAIVSCFAISYVIGTAPSLPPHIYCGNPKQGRNIIKSWQVFSPSTYRLVGAFAAEDNAGTPAFAGGVQGCKEPYSPYWQIKFGANVLNCLRGDDPWPPTEEGSVNAVI